MPLACQKFMGCSLALKHSYPISQREKSPGTAIQPEHKRSHGHAHSCSLQIPAHRQQQTRRVTAFHAAGTRTVGYNSEARQRREIRRKRFPSSKVNLAARKLEADNISLASPSHMHWAHTEERWCVLEASDTFQIPGEVNAHTLWSSSARTEAEVCRRKKKKKATK